MSYCIASINDVPNGKALIVDVKGISIGLFKEKGNIYAVRNICPHKQAPVCKGTVGGTMLPSDPCKFEFGLEGQVLKCPWHGWEFDLTTGDSLFGIASKKLKTYSVYVKESKIYIEI